MRIYAISDLHLSFGADKPMNVFGDKWNNYENKIKENWLSKVKDDDLVILAGDLSWATYLDEAKADFDFLTKLPGKKLLLKGNHDYWWETVTKMNRFLEENGYKNIFFLYNNFYETDEYMICGTRYWSYEENTENEKIYSRELERLKLSIKYASENNPDNKPIIIVTHYPPDERIISTVNEWNLNVKKWIYGHIHSNYQEMLVNIPNIDSYLTSCDYLNFDLLEIN
ncbi:MAG: metallophosphoesterase [Clostridia bacterium]|nr:metallophosphoesterase [Clostridia bacterium]